MAYNGNTIPSGRDITYSSEEVHRKSSEEKYDTAFNKDQKEVLDNFSPSGGGGGGTEPLIVTATKDDNEVWTLDKTYNEIKTAVESGRICVVKGQITVGNSYVFTTYVSYLYVEEGEYFVNVFDINSSPINLPTAFWATSADGYPMYD